MDAGASLLLLRGEMGLLERSDVERDREVAALFDRNYAPMCRLAYVILGDQQQAEEIVMDALLKMFTGWRRIRDIDSIDAYLRRAVVNACRSKIRRKGIENRVNAAIHHRDERRGPDWDPERHETGREVWNAVTKLPERQRAAVVLRYFEDLPEAQIADILDCSVGTVKSQLSKARAKLEKELGAVLQGARDA
ncbi:MAG: SigE family RNA polymerase sigma factor [Actinomycetota bacterium]|nr:SigE family RNA polymerase sigma factor [Actinomycetota bacterium]